MWSFMIPGTDVPYIIVCKNYLTRIIGFVTDIWNTLRHLVDNVTSDITIKAGPEALFYYLVCAIKGVME